jgi:hypothetical protein
MDVEKGEVGKLEIRFAKSLYILFLANSASWRFTFSRFFSKV